MGLPGLDTLKIGLVYAIFILLFPLQTGSRPTLLKNGVDSSLSPDSGFPVVPEPVSLNHHSVNPSLLRHLRADTLSQIYDGILDDGFIDSSPKRDIVSGLHHQFPASKTGDSTGITENKHVFVDDPTSFHKVKVAGLLPEYIVKLKLTDTKWNKSTLQAKLQDIFPSSFIHLSYDKPKNTIEMYISKSGDDPHFISAKEILAKLAASNLVTTEQTVQLDASPPQALPQQSDRGSSSQSSHQHFWHRVWFPYVAAGVATFLVIIVLGAVICYVRYKKKKAEQTPSRRPTHICLYPVATPETRLTSPVQPAEGQQYYVAQTFTTPVPAQPPIRIRAKGLLERRGSSASLTIDLTPTVDVSKSGSPPRESPSREYLLSAGYRMTRKQLRKCLKNLKPLYDEFWEIPMNHPDRVNVAGSGLKNRYKTILPNEHTRIILEETNSDLLTTYINANSIRGYAGEEKAYIATQGPISNTVYDFWRMLWQERTPCVIMITKLMEKGKMKCEQYFPLTPEEGTLVYEDIHVCVTDIAIKDGYEIRELKVTRDGYLNEERKILHFWYTTWPDHKTPDSPKQLLGMVADVEKKRYDHDSDKAKGPVAVHCSAGIGRTGCFIAISIGVRQLQEEQMIDVLGIVCQMRLDRGGMVQNSEQYEFVHRALCMFEKTLPQSSPSGD
ncbi:receptor-type tyrosine-protein phosphatase R-like isoform X2 [Lineus longissimus]|uniref:receptor-type tyrosine-protein phosphatase R-like isoform X2 n=1 Tax=Lineus longissimus TaxID=88925 RepID=UPI00315D79B1